MKPLLYHHVVVRLRDDAPAVGTRYNRVIVPLSRMLEHVQEVWLTEYSIRFPDSAAPISDLWRVNLIHSNLVADVNTNAAGSGHCIAVPNLGEGDVHVVYDTPRVFSMCNRSALTSIEVEVVDEFGRDVIFDTMSIFLTIVTRNPEWSVQQVVANSRNHLEWERSQQNSSRFNP